MACGQVITVCLLAALAVAMAETKGEMMRRQKSHSQIHLDADGKMQMQEDESPKETEQALLKSQGRKTRQPGETSWCDTAMPLGTPQSNDCIKGHPITREEDCRHAARHKGYHQDSGDDFKIKNDWTDNTWAKGCVLVNDTKVYFNPTANVVAAGDFKGTPICEWNIYQAGNVSMDKDEGCTGDYEPIGSYAECEWAHDCQWGGMYCEDPNFGNDQFVTNQAPRGCYRNVLGCYGWNAATTAPDDSWNLTAKTPVCRLKSEPAFNATGSITGAKGDDHTALANDADSTIDAKNDATTQ